MTDFADDDLIQQSGQIAALLRQLADQDDGTILGLGAGWSRRHQAGVTRAGRGIRAPAHAGVP